MLFDNDILHQGVGFEEFDTTGFAPKSYVDEGGLHQVDCLDDLDDETFIRLFESNHSPVLHGDEVVLYDEGIDRLISHKELDTFILRRYAMDIKDNSHLKKLKKWVKLIIARAKANSNSYIPRDECFVIFNNGFFDLRSPINLNNPIVLDWKNTYKPYGVSGRYKVNASWPTECQNPYFNHTVVDSFMNEITGGNPIIVNRIWEMIGYLITPDNNARVLFLLQGEASSGKSVLGKLIANLFYSENISTMNINQLGRTTLASSLKNKRLNLSMDMPNEAISSSAISNLKQFTGNDIIEGYSYFSTAYQTMLGRCKFLFASNHPLVIKGIDDAFVSRIVRIPFTQSIPKEKQNPYILSNLLTHKDYIFQKALEGYMRLVANKYKFSGDGVDICKPKVISVGFATDEIDSTIEKFVDAKCIFGQYRIHTKELYEAYVVFCLTTGIRYIDSARAFSRVFKAHYDYKISGGRWRDCSDSHLHGFKGVTLIEKKDDLAYQDMTIYQAGNDINYEEGDFDSIKIEL